MYEFIRYIYKENKLREERIDKKYYIVDNNFPSFFKDFLEKKLPEGKIDIIKDISLKEEEKNILIENKELIYSLSFEDNLDDKLTINIYSDSSNYIFIEYKNSENIGIIDFITNSIYFGMPTILE